MKSKLLVCLAALLAVAATNEVVKQFEPLKAKLTVKVLDETGQPFSNVDVQIGFEDPKTRREVYTNGKTDADGLFTAEGTCDGSMAGGIQRDGYYWSGFPFKISGVEGNHWLPWNPICVTTLRPIGKPVALYAKTVQTTIPVLGKPCGYDLEAGDWVSPYGKGMKKDLIFTIHQEYHGIQNYDLGGELTFAQPLDGLQEVSIPEIGKSSVFKWERQAPESNYLPKFPIQNTWSPQGKLTQSFKSPDDWQGYFFRVRTVEQNNQIVSAHYGKIRGGIYVYPDRKSDKPKIIFTYYFNPTPNDRNLEWDTKKNLFGNLPFMESPREP
jgi:hypothetical protein